MGRHGCGRSQTPQCAGIRTEFNKAVAQFLPTDADILDWAKTQSAVSGGRFTPLELYDAYRISFLPGATAVSTDGDLMAAADWMRSRIAGDRSDPTNLGEPPLSKIAMGWAVGSNASAQGALGAATMTLAGSIKAGMKIAGDVVSLYASRPPAEATSKTSASQVTLPSASKNSEALKVEGKFEPLGLKDDPKTFRDGAELIIQLERTGLSVENAEIRALEIIQSGSTLPYAAEIGPGVALYKVVPKGGDPSPTTAYWMTESQWRILQDKPEKIADSLGLPPGMWSDAYDVFTIKSQTGGALIFESRIAPTAVDGVHSTNGGALQTIVIDRTQFTKATRVGTIISKKDSQ